jgi:hypothetical protein
MHPDTKIDFVNELVGFGVFAKKFIPRGTITWVRDDFDVIIPKNKITLIPPAIRAKMDKFLYLSSDGYILCWDIARYMNHSCEPNCLGTYNFEIAVRDIAPGEEIVDDYAVYCSDTNEAFTCACGKPSCRGQVHPDDYMQLAEQWDALYFPAFQHIPTVTQPLMPLVKNTGEIERGVRDPSTILSHRQLAELYFGKKSLDKSPIDAKATTE